MLFPHHSEYALLLRACSTITKVKRYNVRTQSTLVVTRGRLSRNSVIIDQINIITNYKKTELINILVALYHNLRE